MGSEQFRPEEAPVRETSVEGFWIDTHDVTNAQFAQVRSRDRLRHDGRTYRPRAVCPQARCSSVHRRTCATCRMSASGGGSSRAPTGVTRMDRAAILRTGRTIRSCTSRTKTRRPMRSGRAARCRRKRNGSSPRVAVATAIAFVWGAEPDRDDAPQANYWRGVFPVLNLGSKGYKGTSPVGCFPANGYGLYDMAGNVWQWTQDAWTSGPRLSKAASREAVSFTTSSQKVQQGSHRRGQVGIALRDQGWLLPLRRKLLHALSSRGATARRRLERRLAYRIQDGSRSLTMPGLGKSMMRFGSQSSHHAPCRPRESGDPYPPRQ